MNKEYAIERMRELVAANVPHVHQGVDLSGIDCVGALVYAFQYKGKVPAYPRDPVNGELERELTTIFGPHIFERPLEIGCLRPLDILSMQYKGPVRHVALVVPHINIPGVLSMIHSDSMHEKVVEHILDFKWERRIVKVWRP
jgi:hypothetical protein